MMTNPNPAYDPVSISGHVTAWNPRKYVEWHPIRMTGLSWEVFPEIKVSRSIVHGHIKREAAIKSMIDRIYMGKPFTVEQMKKPYKAQPLSVDNPATKP